MFLQWMTERGGGECVPGWILQARQHLFVPPSGCLLVAWHVDDPTSGSLLRPAGSDVVGGTETEAVADDPAHTAPGSWFRWGG